MKNTTILLLTMIGLIGMFCSCASSREVSNDDLIGNYYREYKGNTPYCSRYTYFLGVEKNNTFHYRSTNHYVSEESGTWKRKGNYIYLKFPVEKDPLMQLFNMATSGYISTRKFKVLIINENKLQLDNIVLRRIE